MRYSLALDNTSCIGRATDKGGSRQTPDAASMNS